MAIVLQRVLDSLRGLVERPQQFGDAELVRRFVATRDEAAFAELLERHGPMVLGVSRRLLHDMHAAEDVVQATFLTLACKANTLHHPERLAGWLHATAFRLALRVRTQSKRPLEQTLATANDPLEELSAREMFTTVEEELARLPDVYRLPLVLCGLENLSQEETAKRLGWSAGSVRGRLERGRKLLRERLTRRGIALPVAFIGTALCNTLTLPPDLSASTLALAFGRTLPSTTVRELLAFTGSRSSATKLVLVLGVAVITWGIIGAPTTVSHEQDPPVKKEEVKKEVKIADEPLPDGALMRLGTTRQRAVDVKLAFRADNKAIIGLHSGRFISVWESATGQRSEYFDLTKEDFIEAMLSADGRWVFGSRYDDVCLLWDVQKKVEKKLDLNLKGRVEESAFSADGKLLGVVNSQGRTKHVHVRELASDKVLLQTDLTIDAGTYPIAFSPDGRYFIVPFMSVEKGTHCWDLTTGQKVWNLTEFAPQQMAVTNQRVYSAFQKYNVVNLADGKTIKGQLETKIGGLDHLAVTPDDSKLLFSAAKGLTVVDPNNAAAKTMLLPKAGDNFVVSPDGKTVVTTNGELQHWNLTTGKPLWPETSTVGHTNEALALKFSADGKRLVSGGRDGSVRVWDTTTGKTLRLWGGMGATRNIPLSSAQSAGIRSVDITPDGKMVAAGGSDEKIFLWNAETGEALATIDLPQRRGGEQTRYIDFIRLAPDGSRVTAYFNATLHTRRLGERNPTPSALMMTWDIKTNKATAELEVPHFERRHAAVSPFDGSLPYKQTLISAKSGLESVKLVEATDHDEHATFSADGLLLARGHAKVRKDSIGPDGVYVWDAQTGHVVAKLSTPSWVAQLEFHPDSRFLAINDLDSVRLIDCASGRVVWKKTMPPYQRCFSTAGSYASCLAFTNDGRRLATGMPDGSILLWKLPELRDQPKPLASGEIDFLWQDLMGDNAEKAWQAVWRMADFPKESFAFLKPKLKPVAAIPAEEVRQLVADFDNAVFAKRELAMKKLRAHGILAEEMLRAIDKTKLSAEQKQRLETILKELDQAVPSRHPETISQRRAIAVLARLNEPEAKELLQAVAKGVPTHPLTQQARHALLTQR
jgi:RNA polymerase sigma factor (sigma-70 family)